MLESHGNQPNSTSRALKTARDLIGVRAALDSEETLSRAVKVRRPDQAPIGANCVGARTGYGTGIAGLRRVSRVSGAGRLRSART